jgi:hypothetical protein
MTGVAGPVTVVEVCADRVRVRQHLPSNGKQSRRGGGIRGGVTGFTKASRSRFHEVARSLVGLVYEIVLTYADDVRPQDGAEVRGHWDKMRRHLKDTQGLGGIVMREYQPGRGVPHLHIYVNAMPDMAKVRRAWHRITGSSDPAHLEHGAFGKPIGNLAAAINYMGKKADKVAPPGFAGGGRYWAVFGLVQRRTAEAHGGPRERFAPLVRVLRRMEQQARERAGRGPLPSPGHDRQRGFTCWHIKEALTRTDHSGKPPLDRLLSLFGLAPPAPLP